VTRSRTLSPSARDVLALLADAGSGWSYGYDICRRAGIKSGTLYPLLMRLEALGHLEAEWQPSSETGRPPRHAYRLTQTGRALARDNPPVSVNSAAALKPSRA